MALQITWFILLFVLLTLPGHIYELFPVAVLIGTIVALVQMAAHSELTVYRASGASRAALPPAHAAGGRGVRSPRGRAGARDRREPGAGGLA